MRLNFVIAGVQKGATTALHQYLTTHRQVFLSRRKELHFFDNERLNWPCPDYDRIYHRHFADARPEQICGEATPVYTYWPPALERIHAYNPDIKLIITLRDPIERAFSQWRMMKARGRETLSFSTAIREGRDRVANGSKVDGRHRMFSYVERGFYAAQLARVYSYFPRKNVFVLDQRRLISQHEQVLDEICDFLEIERFSKHPTAEIIFSHHHDAAPEIDAKDRVLLGKIYADDLKVLRATYGIDFLNDQ